MKASAKESFSRLQQTIFLLIIFFLPTQLGLHFWPDSAFVLGRRIDYLSPTLFFTDLLIVFLIFTYLLHVFLRIDNTRFKELVSLGRLEKRRWREAVFVLSIIASIVFSSRPFLGIYTLLKLLEFSVFAIISSRLLRRKEMRQRMGFVFILSMLLQSLLVIAQFMLQGSVGGIFYFLGERAFSAQTPGVAAASLNGALVLRPYGTLPHPNVLAGYILVGALVAVSSIRHQVSGIRKASLFLCMLFFLVAFLLAMSRSAMAFGLLLAIGFWLRKIKYQSGRNRKKKARVSLGTAVSYTGRFFVKNKKIFALCIIGPIIFILFFPNIPSRFLEFRLTDEAFVHRRDLMIAALYMFWDHPLFGVGMGNFLSALPSYIELYKTPLQPVHNIYILVLVEAGIVGFALVISFLRNIYSKLSVSRDYDPLLLAAFWATFFLGMLDHYFLTLQQGRLLLALLIGLIMAVNQAFRTPNLEI